MSHNGVLVLLEFVVTLSVHCRASLRFHFTHAVLQYAVRNIIDGAEISSEKTFLLRSVCFLLLHQPCIICLYLSNGLLELLPKALDLVILNSNVGWLDAGVG